MNDSTTDSARRRVALVYHFFAIYRKPVLEELAHESMHEFTFVADSKNVLMPGVVVWKPDQETNFVTAPLRRLWGGFTFQRGLIRLAFRRDLDSIIYLGDWKFISTWISAMLARLMGKRVLFWTHGWRIPDRGIKRIIRKCFYSLAHGLLLYGHRARGIGVKERFKPENLYVVYNSLDQREHERFYNELQSKPLNRVFPNDNPTIICSCRLKQAKRIDLLLEAAVRLREQDNPVNLIIIGDGPEKEALESMAAEHQLDVFFRGACFDEKEIAELTMQADVTVCPGATGLTVIQSFAYGIPVVTNNNWAIQGPEVEAIDDQVNGALFENNDVDSMVEKIKFIIELDPHARQKMSQACREKVQQYYNPKYQVEIIDEAVAGLPAKDG